MGSNYPWGGAIFDPRGMIRRIYVKHDMTLLHTKAFVLAVSEKKICSCISNYNPMTDNDAPGVRACMDSRDTVGRIYKEECYTLPYTNVKAMCLVGLEKKMFFVFFPIVSRWDLYVSMKTRVLTQTASKPNAGNPTPKMDASCKI